MPGSNSPALKWRASFWLIAAVAMVLVLVFRLELSFDLSAFFPRDSNVFSKVLLQQLSSGPGSRMIVMGISGGEQSERIETGRELTEALRGNREIVSVFNGEWQLDDIEIPPPVSDHYPLMLDLDYSASGLRQTLVERISDMAFGGGRVLRDIIARDPFLATLELLKRLAPAGTQGDAWVSQNGSAVVTAQTRSAGSDLQAQALVLDSIRSDFELVRTSPDLELEITGVAAFGLELQSIIQKEARMLGMLAGAVIFLVLLVVYRSLRLALLASVPLALGYLAGWTAVTLAFDTVHGITLAFGFTLLGVTVDYPLHLFSHARQEGGPEAIRSIWPTLRLGAASTALAYFAMVFSGSQGLSQLGVFTAAGVLVAVLVTYTLLPLMLAAKQPRQIEVDEEKQSHQRYSLAVVVLIASIALIAWRGSDGVWNDGLDTLSPVPQSRLQMDQVLRSATGSANLRYQIMIDAPDLQSVLTKSEDINQKLEMAREDGLVEGWTSITDLLPGLQTQQQRLDSIPAPEAFSRNLRSALAETVFTEAAFEPFKEVINSVPDRFPVTPESFDNGSLAVWRDVHLVNLQGRWVALYTLEAPLADELAPRVAQWGESVSWLDLRTQSQGLMRDFRHDAAWAIAIAGLIIGLLLVSQRIGIARLVWVVLTVSAALSASIGVALVVHGYLTLVHMVALLLVLGLGLDYALFMSREDSSAGRRATIQSIIACAASTTLAFAILAISSIPLLRFIGLTVAAGSIASLACALLGSRWPSKSPVN
ncbi:MAG TPA: MMPL family transporter [Xanthomonadales bacterium]|nr:MMPL family transporter [Xanthomonadales bacterium]